MTKLIDRRAVLRGAAKASAALGIGFAPVAAELAIAEATEAPHPDAALERLWRDWLMQLAIVREQAQIYHDAETAYNAAIKAAPGVWRVDFAQDRHSGQKGPFKVYEYRCVESGRFNEQREIRLQPYPGARSYKQVLEAAAAREFQDEAERENALEDAWAQIEWGYWLEEDKRLRAIEAAIADTPAHTLFGVAVKAASARQMNCDHPYGHLLARPETVARAKCDFVAYGAALRAGGAS